MSPAFSRDFPIDSGIFTTAKVSLVDASTDAEVRDAILAVRSDKLPDRDIQLGHIAVAADTGKVSLKPDVVAGASISFEVAASVESGVGIYSKAADAIAALHLADPPALQIEDAAGRRYVVLKFGYSVSSSDRLSHPLGVVGRINFSIAAKRASTFAVLQRFSQASPAHTVLADAFASWRLPRHVKFTNNDVNLKPSTWLIAEVDGSVALKVAATLGWNVSFAKDAALAGVTHNLSARIDASVKATFGLSASGRYVIVVGREDDRPLVRLQLWNQSTDGFTFGFNVDAGVQGADPQLPPTVDDLVRTTFGVHGLQALNDVRRWTEGDISQNVAGLTNEIALSLLTATTGVDAAAEFERARQLLRDALNDWDRLPATVQPMLWKLLSPDGAAELALLRRFLTDIRDPETGAKEVAEVLQRATFGDTVQGRFLEAIADRGLLALAGRFPEVSQQAGIVLSLIDGGFIARLQQYVNEQLDLDQIRKAVSDTDFARVEQWLRNRLASFLDRELDLGDFRDIQKAIATLDRSVVGYYKAAIEALTTRYHADLAATYQTTTVGTALIDVGFDLSRPGASELFDQIAGESRFDDLLIHDVEGVVLHRAKLSHGIKRRNVVDLHLPWFDFRETHVNDAMVTLTAEEDAGRVLVYQAVKGRDDVTAASRASSQLALFATLKMVDGRPAELNGDGAISYEMRQVHGGMRRSDLEQRTSPFIGQYLDDLFEGSDRRKQAFFTTLSQAISSATHHQGDQLGDIALSMRLSLSADLLRAWFTPRNREQLSRDQMQISRAVQAAFRNLLPTLYFRDVTQYALNESVAALLVWSSLPVSTSIDFTGPALRFNTDQTVFWDWPTLENRRAVVHDVHTRTRLAGRVAAIQAELQAANRPNADDFDASKISRLTDRAVNPLGEPFLRTLLVSEFALVDGATRALKLIADSLERQATAPSTAMRALAGFAGTLTKTFNDQVQTIYSGVSGRVIGPMLLLEASAALAPIGVKPAAMLSIAALTPNHAFQLGTFIDGKKPPASEIALTQTLMSLHGL